MRVGLRCETDLQLDFPHFRRPRTILVAAALLLSVAGATYFATRTAAPPPWPSPIFSRPSRPGKVTQVTFSNHTIDVVLRDGSMGADRRASRIPCGERLVCHRPRPQGIRVDVRAAEPGSLS